MSRILMIVGSRREGNSIHLANNLKTIFDHNRISSDIIVPVFRRELTGGV